MTGSDRTSIFAGLSIRHIGVGVLLLNLLGLAIWFIRGRAGDYSDIETLFAQGSYQEFVGQTTNNVGKYKDLVYWRGVALLKLGKYEEAVKAFTNTYKANNNNIVAMSLMKGIALRQKGDTESAELALKKGVSNNMYERSAISLMRGVNFFDMGNMKGARDMLQDSVRLDPICPLGYFYLARITSRENKHAQAVELYEKALFHGFSRTQEFDMTYANSLQHIPERREEVTQMLSPYVESSAGASDALYALLGAVAVGQEKYVEAQQYYVKALAENEFEQGYFVSLADVLAKQEKFEDAAIVLLKGYQLDETKLNLLMRRYVYLVQSGKTEEELADQYARLMSLIGTNKGLYIQFAKQLHEAGFDTQLEIVLQRLFTLDPNNKDGHAIRRDVAVETIMSELRVLDQEGSAGVIETIETAQSFLATEYSTQAITNILDTIVYAKSGDLVSALRAYQLARPVATDSLTNKNIASLLMMYAIYEQDDAMLAAWFDAYAAEITNEKQSNQFAEDAANRIAALDREQLLVGRLVSHFLDQEADRDAFGDELELIDFRFADDQYVYDNAIKIFSYDKKVLQRYYPDFVDPIFEQEEESEGDVFGDESDLFDIIDAPAGTVQ